MRTLVIPPAAQRDEDSIQMLSAWIAENQLHCTLNVGMWEANGKSEARSWGIMLADVIRHLANAIGEKHGVATDVTIREVSVALEAELADPTSRAAGAFHVG